MNPRFLNAALAVALLVALLSACTTTAPRDDATAAPAKPTPQLLTVPERYVSEDSPQDELDSLATWPAEDGSTWLIATGKSTHRLVLFDADSGQRVRTFGSQGSAPGQFNRPNGVAVHGDHLFVAERDNHRVQVFLLPELEVVGSFGGDELRRPYGVWLTEIAPGELEVYITDSFMLGRKFDKLPPLEALDQRVRRYRVTFDQAGRLMANYTGSFGDTTEAAALRMVESIAGDPANDRLLIADASTSDKRGRHESTLREYTTGGRYTGRSLPPASFGAQAEGVALWTCPDGGGYWIAVDPLAPLTIFHLFDRVTLQPRGSFQGQLTAHTDGVALHAAATPSFHGGALFAVHDDKAVTAFDLRDVAKTLALTRGCTE